MTRHVRPCTGVMYVANGVGGRNASWSEETGGEAWNGP